MRRDEFKCDDFALIKTMLSQMPFGTMVIPDTPLPYAVPISFCFDENYATKGGIYFHGAGSGRKFELLKNEPSVVFSAAKPYSYIPSRFLSGKMTPTHLCANTSHKMPLFALKKALLRERKSTLLSVSSR